MNAVIRRTRFLVVLALVVPGVSMAQLLATSSASECPATSAAVFASEGAPAVSPATPATGVDPANNPTFVSWPPPPTNVCCYDCDAVFKYDRLWCMNHFPPGPSRQECLAGIIDDRNICYAGCGGCPLFPY